jgi:hypothetical protein
MTDGMGRPSTYSEEMADEICIRIQRRDPETGHARSLHSVCKDEDMPHESTVYDWRLRRPEFADKYARAVDNRSEMMADDVLDIADTEACPQRARNRMDAKKWHASKMNPKKFGDSTTIKGDAANPLTIQALAAAALDSLPATTGLPPKS